jgi:hypothetical protein
LLEEFAIVIAVPVGSELVIPILMTAELAALNIVGPAYVFLEFKVIVPVPPDAPAANISPPPPLPLITALLPRVIVPPDEVPMTVGPEPLLVIDPVMLTPVVDATIAVPPAPVGFRVMAEEIIALVPDRVSREVFPDT